MRTWKAYHLEYIIFACLSTNICKPIVYSCQLQVNYQPHHCVIMESKHLDKLADLILFTIYYKTRWFSFPGYDNYYLASCIFLYRCWVHLALRHPPYNTPEFSGPIASTFSPWLGTFVLLYKVTLWSYLNQHRVHNSIKWANGNILFQKSDIKSTNEIINIWKKREYFHPNMLC